MLKINQINNNNINFKKQYNKSLDVETARLSSPELVDEYISTVISANKADAVVNNPFAALVNKLNYVYKTLYTPEITKESNEIKNSIDYLVDTQPPAMNLIA